MNTNQNPNPLSTLQLNYWLSVFFVWIPALIFFLMNKDAQSQREREYNAANLNFSILRTLVIIVTSALMNMPGAVGQIALFAGGLFNAMLFIFHIGAAVKLSGAYQRGEKAPFIFNINMVK